MRKESVQLVKLPDSVVISLGENKRTHLYYNNLKITNIQVIDSKNTSKYRLNTTQGQYRDDNPEIVIMY